MDTNLLFEGGIRTAQLDLMLTNYFRDTAPEIIDEILTKMISYLGLKPEGDEADAATEIERGLAAIVKTHPKILSNPFLIMLSQGLSKVVARYTLQAMKIDPDNVGGLTHGQRAAGITADALRVFVDDIEVSNDPSRHDSHGYYSEQQNLIRIFVDPRELSEAIDDLVELSLHGSTQGDAKRYLFNFIRATLVHEYAHLEQVLRRKPAKPSRHNPTGEIKDRTYITTGIAGNRRVPKRGGTFRDPSKDLANKLQYSGSLHEIDSFAAGTASELVSAVRLNPRLRGLKPKEWNDAVDALKTAVATGVVSSDSFAYYAEIMRKRFDSEYAVIRANPAQIEKVWRRFCKLVAVKLDDYKADKAGVMKADRAAFRAYHKAVDGKSGAMALAALAEAVAVAIWDDVPGRLKALGAALAGAGEAMHSAEEFITQQIFEADDPRLPKVLEIFRRMVGRHIADHEAVEYRQAA
jgi:hypothetical protein